MFDTDGKSGEVDLPQEEQQRRDQAQHRRDEQDSDQRPGVEGEQCAGEHRQDHHRDHQSRGRAEEDRHIGILHPFVQKLSAPLSPLILLEVRLGLLPGVEVGIHLFDPIHDPCQSPGEYIEQSSHTGDQEHRRDRGLDQ